MTNPLVSRALYALAVIANFVLTAFAIQLGAGKVPIPEASQWTVPLISAAVTAALMFLPRAGAEDLARQVDALKQAGVPRRQMVVVSQEEAIRGIANAPPPDEGRMESGR